MSFKRNLSWREKPAKKVDGKWLCRWCRQPCPGRRTSYCSDTCSNEFLLRASPNYMRSKVFERDKGICSLCGMDTEAKRKEVYAIRKIYGYSYFKDFLKQMKIPENRVFSSLWDADHIMAVIENGGQCGLENIRSLCIWCHRIVTAQLRKRLAQERKCSKHGRLLGYNKD